MHMTSHKKNKHMSSTYYGWNLSMAQGTNSQSDVGRGRGVEKGSYMGNEKINFYRIPTWPYFL